MADQISYEDLRGLPEFQTATAQGQLEALNVVSRNGAQLIREQLLSTEEYNDTQLAYEQSYGDERSDIIQEEYRRILAGLDSDEDRKAVSLAAARNDPSLLTGKNNEAFVAMRGVPALAENLQRPPIANLALTSQGPKDFRDARESSLLGFVNIHQRMDGNLEGDVNVEGVTGRDKTVSMVIDPEFDLKMVNKEIEVATEQRDKSKATVDTLGEDPSGFAQQGMLGGLRVLERDQGALDTLEERKALLESPEAFTALLSESLHETLRGDAYKGKIGQGFTDNFGAPIIAELLRGGLIEGPSRLTQGLIIGATAPFTDVEEGEVDEAGLPKKSIAERGGLFVRDFQAATEKLVSDLGLEGVTEARFRGGFGNDVAVGALNQLPQVAMDLAIAGVGSRVLKAGAAGWSESAVGKHILKHADVRYGGLIASMSGGTQEAADAWATQMDFVDTQLGSFESVEAIRTVADVLEGSEEEGAKEQAADLHERADAAEVAQENAALNFYANFATVSVTEYLPTSRLLKRGNQFSLTILDRAATRRMKNWALGKELAQNTAMGFVEQGGQEGLQTLASNQWAIELYNKNQDLYEGVDRAMAIGAIIGVATNAVATGNAAVMRQAALAALDSDPATDRDVRRAVRNLVVELEDGKFTTSDPGFDETFETATEAKDFAERRFKGRLFQQFRGSEALEGRPEEEVDATLSVIDTLVSEAAVATEQDSDEVFEKISFLDVSRSDPDQGFMGPEELVSKLENEVLPDIIEPEASPEPQENPERDARVLAIDGKLAEETLPQDERDVLEQERRDLLLEDVSTEQIEEQAEKDPDLRFSDTAKNIALLEEEIADLEEGDPDIPIKEQEIAIERAKAREEAVNQEREEEAPTEKQQEKIEATPIPNATRGSIESFAKQNRVLIKAFKGGDPSTLLHEMLHAVDLLTDNHGKSLLDAVIGRGKTGRNFWNWATEDGKNKRDSFKTRERLAQGFERFLAEGVVPQENLTGAFRTISKMLRSVYEGLLDFDQGKLSKKARKGYARIFANQPDTINSVTGNVSTGGFSLLSTPPSDEQLQQDAIPESEVPPEGTQPQATTEPITFNQDGTPEGVTVTDPRTMLDGNTIRSERKMGKLERIVKERISDPALPTRFRLPQQVWASNVKREGFIDRIKTELRFLTRDFKTALKKAVGKKKDGSGPDLRKRKQIVRAVNDYMVERDGDKKAAILQTIHPDIRALAIQMRTSIDVLSREAIRAGIVTGKLAAVFDENDGSYLHRSYQIFDTPKWAKKVRRNEEAIINNAKQFFKDNFGAKTEAQQDELVNFYLNTENFAGGPTSFFDNKPKGATSKLFNSLLKKKQIPEEIRALWGEYKDPIHNYSNSVIKLANLIATHEFLNFIKEDGLRRGYLGPPGSEGSGQGLTQRISSLNAKSLDPIHDFVATEDFANALQNAFQTTTMFDAFSPLVKANQRVKKGLTVFSPATQMRNFLGSGIMYFGNGHANPIDVFKAARITAAGVTKGGGMDIRELYLEMVQLGIIDQNVVVSEFQSVFKDLMGSENVTQHNDTMIDKIWNASAGRIKGSKKVTKLGKKAGGVVVKGFKSADKVATDLYRAGDAIWKAAAYMSELRQLTNAMGSEVEVEDLKLMAANRVRATMPTYSLVPKPIQSLSKNPALGVFVSFTSESVRITYNQAKMAARDIVTPGMRTMGWRRLGGLMASRVGVFAGLSAFTRGMADIDREMDEWLRDMVPFYDRFGDFIYAGRDENGNPIYSNAQFVNPYSYMNNIWSAAMQIDGGEFFSKDPKEGIASVMKEIFEPWLQPELVTKYLVEVSKNSDTFGKEIYNEDDLGDMVTKSMWHGFKSLQPGFIRQEQKFQAAVMGRAFKGQKKDVSDVAFEFASGLNYKTPDLNRAVGFRMNGINEALNNTRKGIVAKARNGEDIVRSMQNANDERRAIFQKANKMAFGLLKWGRTEKEVTKILEDSNLTNAEARAIMRQEYIPISLTTRDAEKIEKVNPGFLRAVVEEAGIDIRNSAGKKVSPRTIERKMRKKGGTPVLNTPGNPNGSPPPKADISRISNVLNANKGKNFVQRILRPELNKPIDLGGGEIATHLMSFSESDGKFFVYPTVVDVGDGELRQLSDDDAWDHSQRTGEFIKFNKESDASWFSKNYKKWWAR